MPERVDPAPNVRLVVLATDVLNEVEEAYGKVFADVATEVTVP